MIEIKNFSKSYPGVPLYDNFNLSVKDGEIVAILGESGSGKTTLLNAVAGLTPYAGEITGLKCGYVFQSPRLVPCLTVKGNLKLVCKDDEKIARMLEKTGLSDKGDSYPVSLSGGQAQRVSLARAFLFRGDAVLMDEPFSSLDLKLKREMADLFFGVWEEYKPSVLFVTHDVDEAMSLGERIIVISQGKIVFDETPQSPPPRENDNVLREKLIKVLLCG